MPIDLGLSRISKLFSRNPQPWAAIHIAGTNGKGSIAAYLSFFLARSGIASGRFTSPHLFTPRDSICISPSALKSPFSQYHPVITPSSPPDLNPQPISPETYNAHRARMLLMSSRLFPIHDQPTEFELLVATAFSVFSDSSIRLAVIECGVGGARDATNVLVNKVATCISSISLDHQGLLGQTLEEIAREKAGIMRQHVPCFVARPREPSVRAVLEECARDVQCPLHFVGPPVLKQTRHFMAGRPAHELQNLAVALAAFEAAYPSGHPRLPLRRLLPGVEDVRVPGRLQTVTLRGGSEGATGRHEYAHEFLVDGAHNEASAKVLGQYVDKKMRGTAAEGVTKPVTWVLAMSKGKDLHGIVKHLLRKGDTVVAMKFGPVEDMPWVEPEDPELILKAARWFKVQPKRCFNFGTDIERALRHGLFTSKQQPLVVAGSLYLVADVLRCVEKIKERRGTENKGEEEHHYDGVEGPGTPSADEVVKRPRIRGPPRGNWSYKTLTLRESTAANSSGSGRIVIKTEK